MSLGSRWAKPVAYAWEDTPWRSDPRVRKPDHRGRPFFGASDAGRSPREYPFSVHFSRSHFAVQRSRVCGRTPARWYDRGPDGPRPLVADLLTETPGAMIVRSGAPGALTSLFVRGGESDYNKVLLDGVPLNEPGGTFYLSNLTTENLERVEIVRGAYSSLFGSDAMASVIQLFTRRADPAARRPKVSAQIDGGTYHTVHANAGVSGATERL